MKKRQRAPKELQRDPVFCSEILVRDISEGLESFEPVNQKKICLFCADIISQYQPQMSFCLFNDFLNQTSLLPNIKTCTFTNTL